MEDIKKRMADFLRHMKKRDYMTKSEAMAQGFADAISHADTRAVEPPRRKASDSSSDALFSTATIVSSPDPWAKVRGYTTAAWIDDLIVPTPTIKSLGIPKANHD